MVASGQLGMAAPPVIDKRERIINLKVLYHIELLSLAAYGVLRWLRRRVLVTHGNFQFS